MNINDCILGALGPGQINDLLLQYYKDNGALSSDINDAEREFLEANGAAPANVNGMWYQFLRSRGALGSLTDMLKEFWCVDGGAINLRMQNGAVPEGGLSAVVNFSDIVTFTEGTLPNGMTIRNTSLGEPESAVISAAVGSGTSQVTYTISWTTPPIYGDVLEIEYNGEGDYTDPDTVPMAVQILGLSNQAAQDLEILATRIIQEEAGPTPKIIRSQVIEIEFNQTVLASTVNGVLAKVHGAAQTVVLSGSGTDTLRYTVQRAIFRHVVSWAYDGLGDIQAAASGAPLGVIPEKPVDNILPVFTVWDYDAGAPNADTDTLWDTDETRYDEV